MVAAAITSGSRNASERPEPTASPATPTGMVAATTSHAIRPCSPAPSGRRSPSRSIAAKSRRK